MYLNSHSYNVSFYVFIVCFHVFIFWLYVCLFKPQHLLYNTPIPQTTQELTSTFHTNDNCSLSAKTIALSAKDGNFRLSGPLMRNRSGGDVRPVQGTFLSVKRTNPYLHPYYIFPLFKQTSFWRPFSWISFVRRMDFRPDLLLKQTAFWAAH